MSGWLWFGFMLLFAAWWLIVMTIMAKWGGWSALARRYVRPSDARPSARTYFQSLVLRSPAIFYNGCVNVGASERGLFLSILPPFQFGHPYMMIPWDRVRSLGRRRYWLVVYDWYAFEGSSKSIGFPTWCRCARLVRRYVPTSDSVGTP
jgi:hypothetical protein